MIPIKNIYFLLCYAWDKLEEKDKIRVDIDDTTKLSDLFAKILINGTKLLLKRGIDRSYIDHSQELAGIKGKLLVADTLKANLLLKRKAICAFDEFSPNILLNQILVTTLLRLTRIKDLDRDLRLNLRKLVVMFEGITEIDLKASHFKQIRLNRNNSFYEFLLHVCKIVHDNILPSENSGQLYFLDFVRDDRQMNRLFEAFVRNFYKKEQQKFTTVRREGIRWKLTPVNANSNQYYRICKLILRC